MPTKERRERAERNKQAAHPKPGGLPSPLYPHWDYGVGVWRNDDGEPAPPKKELQAAAAALQLKRQREKRRLAAEDKRQSAPTLGLESLSLESKKPTAVWKSVGISLRADKHTRAEPDHPAWDDESENGDELGCFCGRACLPGEHNAPVDAQGCPVDIQCHGCFRWCHGECAGLDEEIEEGDDEVWEYMCVLCQECA